MPPSENSKIDLIREGVIPPNAPGWGTLIQFDNLPTEIIESANTAAFKRLAGIGHAGFDPQRLHFPYTRALHSLVATAVAQYILKKGHNLESLRVSIQEILHGALWHDGGHFAASHSAEHAFDELDHKENGVRIIKEDPEIQRIHQEYGIKTERVIAAGMEKFDGNPFALKRPEGNLSLDHLANIITDLYMRSGTTVHPKTLERLLNSLYLNKQAKLALPEKEIELMQMMTRLVIAQNFDVFGPRSMLNDALGEHAMLILAKVGLLKAEDLANTDAELLRIFDHPKAPELVKEFRYAITHTIPWLTDESVEKIIKKSKEEGVTTTDCEEGKVYRTIHDLYLLTPMLGEQSAIEVLGEEISKPFDDARKKLLGTFEIDVDRLLVANNTHRRVAGRGENRVWIPVVKPPSKCKPPNKHQLTPVE